MVAAIAIVLGIVVIVGVAIPWLVKAIANMDKDVEDHLHDPETPRVSYQIPNGVDASVLRNALTTAGIPSALDLTAGEERLLIECHPGEREHVREVIADIEREYAATGLRIGAVTFTDE